MHNVTFRFICYVAAVVLGHSLPAAPVSAASDPGTDAVMRTLELTNVERANHGLPPLALSRELSRAAQTYAEVLANSDCFQHTCGPVPDMRDRVEQAGYTGWTAMAENIAAGYRSPEIAIAAWMGSDGHRANMLNPHYTEIGIGMSMSDGSYGVYWTQNFGARPGVATQDHVIATAPSEPELEMAPDALSS